MHAEPQPTAPQPSHAAPPPSGEAVGACPVVASAPQPTSLPSRGETSDPQAVTDSQRALRQLRWIMFVGPVAAALLFEISHRLIDHVINPTVDLVLVAGVALALAAAFYRPVMNRVQVLQRDLARQNRELLGLHAAALAVAADLSLDSVLQTVVDHARSLVGTRYGALSVVDENGEIRAFLTTGIDDELRAVIGHPPRGQGLLGVVLNEGEHLRLESIQVDPRSAGFPENHPVMRTLLAVPVLCQGPYRGNLYLSEKEEGSLFSAEDEKTLVRFARQAAIAIDNAYLHRQVDELAAARERLHIAHEMHDGVAQVLAFVNTQTQVVREYCRQKRLEDAELHLERLAEAARQVYSDVRAQILELRSAAPSEIGLSAALADFSEQWQRLTGIEVSLEMPEALQVEPDAELPAAAHHPGGADQRAQARAGHARLGACRQRSDDAAPGHRRRRCRLRPPAPAAPLGTPLRPGDDARTRRVGGRKYDPAVRSGRRYPHGDRPPARPRPKAQGEFPCDFSSLTTTPSSAVACAASWRPVASRWSARPAPAAKRSSRQSASTPTSC